jgi:hypothetical protein
MSFILTLVVIILLVIRLTQDEIRQNIEFLLRMRNISKILPYTAFKKEKKYHKLFFEIFIHLLMPYTFTNLDWKMTILGNEVRYSINTFLVCFATFRLYVVFKFIKHINIYSSHRSARITSFFNINNTYIFLYRSNMFYRGFFTIIFLCGFIFYMFTIIFKLLENFKTNDDFILVENCMWFLIVTMTTSKLKK